MWLQTAENKLNRIRKEIFTAEQAKQNHHNKLKLVEHRTTFRVKGQTIKLQNITKGKKQEKANRRDALQERYQVMTSNLGIVGNSSVSTSFCGAKACGGAMEQGGMMGIYGQPQLRIEAMFGGGMGSGGGMYGQLQHGAMFGGGMGRGGGMYGQPQHGN